MRTAGLVLLCLLTACSESDNVSWVIICNPSGGFGPVQGGLVVSWRYSSKSFSLVGGTENAGRPVALRLAEQGGPNGSDPNVSRDIYLATDTDAVVIVQSGGGEIHSPALTGGLRRVTGQMIVQPKPDSATALRIETPIDVVHLAAAGNLVIVESAAGIFARRPDIPERVFPLGSDVDAVGDDYLIIEPSGRRTVVKPPPATPIGSQAEFDAARGSYRFFSYSNQFSAELPASRFQVMDGATGIRLDGEFPNAAGGALDSPFRAILPARNHHLLLVRRD